MNRRIYICLGALCFSVLFLAGCPMQDLFDLNGGGGGRASKVITVENRCDETVFLTMEAPYASEEYLSEGISFTEMDKRGFAAGGTREFTVSGLSAEDYEPGILLGDNFYFSVHRSGKKTVTYSKTELHDKGSYNDGFVSSEYQAGSAKTAWKIRFCGR